MIFFEQARAQAEAAYSANSQDAAALTRWGGALLELAHFKQGGEASEMINEAIRRLERAVDIDSHRADALWCLGNAYTSKGFLTASTAEAKQFFNKATDCFKGAHNEEPDNEVYKKALVMTEKAPALHAQLQEQLQEQMGGASGRQRQKPTSDFWWDVAGWVTLISAVSTLGVLASRANLPGPPTAPPMPK
eukprot:jgi/Astpho2/5552/e_gw1.00079.277.1_t